MYVILNYHRRQNRRVLRCLVNASYLLYSARTFFFVITGEGIRFTVVKTNKKFYLKVNLNKVDLLNICKFFLGEKSFKKREKEFYKLYRNSGNMILILRKQKLIQKISFIQIEIQI